MKLYSFRGVRLPDSLPDITLGPGEAPTGVEPGVGGRAVDRGAGAPLQAQLQWPELAAQLVTRPDAMANQVDLTNTGRSPFGGAILRIFEDYSHVRIPPRGGLHFNSWQPNRPRWQSGYRYRMSFAYRGRAVGALGVVPEAISVPPPGSPGTRWFPFDLEADGWAEHAVDFTAPYSAWVDLRLRFDGGTDGDFRDWSFGLPYRQARVNLFPDGDPSLYWHTHGTGVTFDGPILTLQGADNTAWARTPDGTHTPSGAIPVVGGQAYFIGCHLEPPRRNVNGLAGMTLKAQFLDRNYNALGAAQTVYTFHRTSRTNELGAVVTAPAPSIHSANPTQYLQLQLAPPASGAFRGHFSRFAVNPYLASAPETTADEQLEALAALWGTVGDLVIRRRRGGDLVVPARLKRLAPSQSLADHHGRVYAVQIQFETLDKDMHGALASHPLPGISAALPDHYLIRNDGLRVTDAVLTLHLRSDDDQGDTASVSVDCGDCHWTLANLNIAAGNTLVIDAGRETVTQTLAGVTTDAYGHLTYQAAHASPYLLDLAAGLTRLRIAGQRLNAQSRWSLTYRGKVRI